MKRILVCLAVAACALAIPASAATVLTFEGLRDNEAILNFYNGGTGSLGSSGPNYGIGFGADSLALIDADAGGSGNFANEPSPNTIAYFLSGSGVVMNVAAGFTTGFSFYYTSSTAGSVTIWDGLNATGNLLGTINVAANAFDGCPGDPSGPFNCWSAIGAGFSGTAMSVDFGGTANQTGYDNITLGDVRPGDVPEPGTYALMGTGLAALMYVVRRRRTA